MLWLSPCLGPHWSLSACYTCDERKQIPLFSNLAASRRFPCRGPKAKRPIQLKGGIQ